MCGKHGRPHDLPAVLKYQGPAQPAHHAARSDLGRLALFRLLNPIQESSRLEARSFT